MQYFHRRNVGVRPGHCLSVCLPAQGAADGDARAWRRPRDGWSKSGLGFVGSLDARALRAHHATEDGAGPTGCQRVGDLESCYPLDRVRDRMRSRRAPGREVGGRDRHDGHQHTCYTRTETFPSSSLRRTRSSLRTSARPSEEPPRAQTTSQQIGSAASSGPKRLAGGCRSPPRQPGEP